MDDLIYDRTEADLLNKTDKAYYNYTDINRIEEWCEYLANKLNNYNYTVDIIVKTNWAMTDFPTVSEMERIRGNIDILKERYFAFTEVPDNLNFMGIEKANAIEKILEEINVILKNMENYFVHSGVASCGQGRLWQQRFRR